MREIKFRGKSLTTGEWVYGDLRQDKIENKVYVDECEVDHNAAGQYTGVEDKNGREMYEGDLILIKTHEENIRIICYENRRMASFVAKGATAYSDTISTYLQRVYEVVGNIYDNPGIIEEETKRLKKIHAKLKSRRIC